MGAGSFTIQPHCFEYGIKTSGHVTYILLIDNLHHQTTRFPILLLIGVTAYTLPVFNSQMKDFQHFGADTVRAR